LEQLSSGRIRFPGHPEWVVDFFSSLFSPM
jgi:hypothetical protein